MPVTVRPIDVRDAAPWAALFRGYRAFYNHAQDDAVVATTWGWVIGNEHEMFGLVAVDHDDKPIALANLRWFARPSVGAIGLFLDDLFTAPEARGTGAATALIERAAAIAGEHSARVVRWNTAADNEVARRVYDRLAVAGPWVTYDMKPTPRAPTP
jgi:GNAT superfamily N-acetyltransferase